MWSGTVKRAKRDHRTKGQPGPLSNGDRRNSSTAIFISMRALVGERIGRGWEAWSHCSLVVISASGVLDSWGGGGGGGGGGVSGVNCRFLRNPNVACACLYFCPCRMSNLGNDNVSCHYLFLAPVTCPFALCTLAILRKGCVAMSN